MSREPMQPRFVEVDYDPFSSDELARSVPTTESQRELWLAARMGTDASLAYNESVSLRIRGHLDASALQNALLALSDRHEALRATVDADGSQLMVAPRGALQAVVDDLSSLGPQAADAQAEASRRRAVDEPFDLVAGPLCRAELLRFSDTRHELILTGHHIVCDGWSFGVLATELMALYREFAAPGEPATPLPTPDSFCDYVLDELGDAGRERAEADTRWWLERFDGAVPVLELPLDRPRPTVRTFASRREDLALEPDLVRSLRTVGARHGASLFATLFSTFGALLGRLSGQRDVVVGVPAAGQADAGRQSLVGHCVQLLPIRLDVDPDASARDLLEQARGRVLDAFEHQHCTFGLLLRKLQLARDASRLPLVSVLFNLDQDIREEALSGAGLVASAHGNPRSRENFELFLNATQRGAGIVLECQYNTDLFDAATIRRWLELYRTALERLASDPARTVADVLAPTDADLASLAAFNRTALAVPTGSRVEASIAAQAAATPDAIAVVAGDTRLTYAALDRRANAIAHALRASGVREGDLVGLCCGRNAHMIAALLGILKAGAGYVPMDPAFPAERLAYMCEDATLRVVATDRGVDPRVVPQGALRLEVDGLGESPEAPPAATRVDDVAYVIYTSGSTGRPKGVRVPHRSVVNLLASVAAEPGMEARHVVLSVTTLSFDIAVSEVILPLTVGARIVVADRAEVVDGDALRALVERERVDFIDATPSTWRLLLAARWPGDRSLRAICTGEPLPPDLGRELLPRVGELWNGYGPTETTVWSSFHRVTSIESTVPIGRPIANTQIHVVDPQRRTLPIGVVGELYIGGDGVTLGYLGRDDLTGERFLPDPHRPGHRWYRTGDLGRWRADGVLECLGRADHQVKVRGYRIELGEIESNLALHPGVARCIVVTREDTPGDVRLVAYVVPNGDAPDANDLRDFLRRFLPEYMLPSHVVTLDAIPLLPNGKLDRGALPEPVRAAGDRAAARAPSGPIESAVLAAFEQVLKLPELSVDDDFFALGGHSLLAARLVTRLNRELGLELPLRSVFEAPTVEGLARIAASLGRPAGRRAVPHRAERREAPLTVMQERIRLMEVLHPGRVTYNTPSAHRLRGPFDPQAFGAALRALAMRQPSLRTRIVDAAGGAVQRVDDDADIALPFEDLSGLPAESRESALMRRLEAIIDTPIRLDRSPLLRCALFRMAPEEHVFLFMPHHIVWDGWSFDLLYDEMAALYPAALEGRAPSIEPLPVTYLDYAAWHREWMQGEDCAAQVRHWKDAFASIAPPQPVPTDRPRASGMTGAGSVEWIRADVATTERLRSTALGAGVTLNMLVMGVFAAMLGEATGSPSLVVGVPVRGRLAPEVEGVMGFFNNLLPVPLSVPAGASLRDWLGDVKRVMLDAMANQDVPFERLGEEPEISAHVQRAGLYQSLYSFQDARERNRRWGPLEHASVLVMQKGSTEDLGLWLMEVPGGLEGGLNYNADLFEPTTARMLVDRLLGLLHRAADRPDATLRTLLDAPGADADAFGAWLAARRASAPPPSATGVPAGSGGPAADATAPCPREGDAARRELDIARIWAGLLGMEPEDIGPADNFLDLGGSSLLFMRALSQMDAELGLKVEPRRLLGETLRQLAADGATAAVDAAGRR